jgi:hypothetical protein
MHVLKNGEIRYGFKPKRKEEQRSKIINVVAGGDVYGQVHFIPIPEKRRPAVPYRQNGSSASPHDNKYTSSYYIVVTSLLFPRRQ